MDEHGNAHTYHMAEDCHWIHNKAQPASQRRFYVYEQKRIHSLFLSVAKNEKKDDEFNRSIVVAEFGVYNGPERSSHLVHTFLIEFFCSVSSPKYDGI